MTMEVIRAGFYTLVQDFGRYGYQRLGVTNGGPLDEHAFLWANQLLGNHYKAAQLEIFLGGVAVRFTRNAMIALCGADLSATRSGQALAPWQTYFMRAGDELSFTAPKSGSRCYLAIKGGFEIEPQLSSCATVQREKLGGLHQNGEKLGDKDVLPYQSSKQETLRSVPHPYRPDYTRSIELRFIPNRSETGSDLACLAQFTTQTFIVTPQIDRMGFRLSGEAIHSACSGIISQGIALGAIQMPKDGQPIVLMRDRQTMGGYPQMGCVAYLDISKLAQSMPGTEVRFTPVSIAELESELIAYKGFFGIDV